MRDIEENQRASTLKGIALTLMLVTVWALLHRYAAFDRDGQLYAVEAMARIAPNFASDLFLQNTSQDRYTIFPAIYAASIRLVGLQNAAFSLTMGLTIAALGGAWVIARHLATPKVAWLCVATVIGTVQYYGSFQIFHFLEDYLSARLLAETLIIGAFSCVFAGSESVGIVMAVAALFVHPLVALPAALVLACLRMPLRYGVIGAVGGILTIVFVALSARAFPSSARFMVVMDPSWLEVVRERSPHLFLEYWSTHDWLLNARPFLCLAVTVSVFEDGRARRFSIASMLVGLSGLLIAIIPSVVCPLAVLLQGQAWRWVWIGAFAAALLLVPTIFRVFTDKRCGRFCAMLLICAWTAPALEGTMCALLALCIWLAREGISGRWCTYLNWASVGIAVWLMCSLLITSGSKFAFGVDALSLQRVKDIAALQLPLALLVGLIWWWMQVSDGPWPPAAVIAVLAPCLLYILPAAFNPIQNFGVGAAVAATADWRDKIPISSKVYIARDGNYAAFVWLNLQRASYLSASQSAGVVFSRATALEVKRRSQVVSSLIFPDWRILSRLKIPGYTSPLSSAYHAQRPLTAPLLRTICEDPAMDFLIAKEFVGFEGSRHTENGAWKDWTLYDCQIVRTHTADRG